MTYIYIYIPPLGVQVYTSPNWSVPDPISHTCWICVLCSRSPGCPGTNATIEANAPITNSIMEGIFVVHGTSDATLYAMGPPYIYIYINIYIYIFIHSDSVLLVFLYKKGAGVTTKP